MLTPTRILQHALRTFPEPPKPSSQILKFIYVAPHRDAKRCFELALQPEMQLPLYLPNHPHHIKAKRAAAAMDWKASLIWRVVPSKAETSPFGVVRDKLKRRLRRVLGDTLRKAGYRSDGSVVRTGDGDRGQKDLVGALRVIPCSGMLVAGPERIEARCREVLRVVAMQSDAERTDWAGERTRRPIRRTRRENDTKRATTRVVKTR